MAADRSFDVSGLDKLIKKLNSLGGDSVEAVEKGMNDAVLRMQRDAKMLCPVGDVNGGHLRESIVTWVQHKPGEVLGVVSTNVFYAIYQEYGTGIHAENGKGRQDAWSYKRADTGEWVTTHGNKPQPFMRPALTQNTENIMRDISTPRLAVMFLQSSMSAIVRRLYITALSGCGKDSASKL